MPEPTRRRRRTLLYVVVGVALGLVVGGFIAARVASRDEPQCVAASVDFTGTTIRSPQQALDDYLANHEEPLPLGGWTVQQTTPDGAIFTSDEGGHWTAEVRGGHVTSYSGCRS